jgi:hypothetical protein
VATGAARSVQMGEELAVLLQEISRYEMNFTADLAGIIWRNVEARLRVDRSDRATCMTVEDVRPILDDLRIAEATGGIYR